MEETNEFVVQEAQNEITTKFNWGGFMLGIYFGPANRVWIGLLGLLAFIPIVGWIFGIIWAFIIGFKGEKWSLEKNEYRDNEEFRKIMDGWNRAGIVAFIFMIAFAVLMVIYILVIAANVVNLINNNPYSY